MYRLNQNQDIIEILLRIKEHNQEYPAHLLAARRANFMTLMTRYTHRYLTNSSLTMKTPLIQE
jgi:hypothetical protein